MALPNNPIDSNDLWRCEPLKFTGTWHTGRQYHRLLTLNMKRRPIGCCERVARPLRQVNILLARGSYFVGPLPMESSSPGLVLNLGGIHRKTRQVVRMGAFLCFPVRDRRVGGLITGHRCLLIHRISLPRSVQTTQHNTPDEGRLVLCRGICDILLPSALDWGTNYCALRNSFNKPEE